MCRCAQAWCCNNPFNYSSLQSCLSVAENAVHLGKKSLRKDDQCEHCRVVYGSFAVTVGSIATLCDWLKILRHPALIHSNQSRHARSQAIPALGVLDSFREVIGSQNHRLALWLADVSSHTGTWDKRECFLQYIRTVQASTIPFMSPRSLDTLIFTLICVLNKMN